ncbi:MAG: RNA methyltransferase [Bdellovibrionota bacterium]
MNIDKQAPEDAWRFLQSRLTENRKRKMLQAAKERTNHIRLVLQDIHSPHNVSACMRSAEAFGVLNIDVVHLNQPFKPTVVAKGVSNWLRITKHQSIESCAETLHKSGYKIIAGMPTQNSSPLEELQIDQPLAILFGNEHLGVSDEWSPFIDQYFTIPMYGFVESLNISVSAAITMHQLTHKARHNLPASKYFLNEAERDHLLDEWVCKQFPTWEIELTALRKR